jgi:hypothetical protein
VIADDRLWKLSVIHGDSWVHRRKLVGSNIPRGPTHTSIDIMDEQPIAGIGKPSPSGAGIATRQMVIPSRLIHERKRRG